MRDQIKTVRDRIRRRPLPFPPIGESDLARAPDYVGIGVQRAGTTRVQALITEHPDAVEVFDRAGSATKETHWFRDPVAEASVEHARAYESWFRAPADKVVGEFTPRYLYDQWPLDQLRQHYPDVKLLVFLREPVSRLASALRFREQRGLSADEQEVSEAIDRGTYGRQLEYLFEHWPRNQVFVALFEDFNTQPREAISQLYDFLELDPSFVPESIDTQIHASAAQEIDDAVLSKARDIYSEDRARVSSVLPEIDLSPWDVG